MHCTAKAVFRVCLIALALISLGGNLSVNAQNRRFAQWQEFDFSKRVISLADLEGLNETFLKYMRGIVFGKHGRVFKEGEIQGYLVGLEWYKPRKDFKNSMLNDTERKNLDLIREAEAKQHEQIEAGDLRFWQNRRFTPEQLGEHSLGELRILRAELEAIHGKRFDDEPVLQTYFEERYWYKPAAHYDPSQLTQIERDNLATLVTAEKQKRNVQLSPGDMLVFQNRLLTEDLLAGLSLHELRILRNEIYALRGRRFRTEWLQGYFNSQAWYTPLANFREPKLSETETKNIATILRYENRLHEKLSAELISPRVLEGMFLEDAVKLRNEIFARRGRVFKNRWLQQYFASFPWYKANPNFDERLLTEIEKQNVATIQEYEKTALSLLEMVEG